MTTVVWVLAAWVLIALASGVVWAAVATSMKKGHRP